MTAFQWRIELFGSLRLLQEDQVVYTFPPSKAGELLAYLACHAKRAHARQELAECFWPETDHVTGRTRLRQHLTTLRRQLEPDGITPGSVLRTDRDAVSLAPSSFTTDIADFEAALRRAKQTSDAGECNALLNRAVSLYRGELLSGYHEDWIQREREHLKERVIGALRELASYCEEAGDLSRSIDYVQRQVAVDPLREGSHFALIRLLIAAQQPAAARRQYKTLEHLLKVAWNQTPSMETQTLFASLSAGEGRSRLVSAIPDADTSPALPAVPLEEDVLPDSQPQPDFSEDTSKAQEAPVPSAAPEMPVSPPARRFRYRRMVLAVLLFVLIAGGLGLRRLVAPDDNPAHRNFSPAAIKSGKQEETWIRRYETKPDDADSEPTAMVVDKAGNIYVTGFIQTRTRDVDYLTLKYAPDGTPLWENRNNGTGNDVDRPYSIAVDAAGNVYVTGESYGTTGDDLQDQELSQLDIVTVKYNAKGEKVREARYDGPGQGRDSAPQVALDGKGNVYVLGTEWDGYKQKGRDGYRMVLIQYDANLEKKNWAKPYPGKNGADSFCNAMALDSEGFVYVTGSDGTGFVTLKYDSSGHQIWVKPPPMPQNWNSTPMKILMDDSDNLYVVCQANQTIQKPPTGRLSIQVVKFDKKGNLLWERIFSDPKRNYRAVGAYLGAGVYVTGRCEAPGMPFMSFLMCIGGNGDGFQKNHFYGAPRGDQTGVGVVVDHHNLVHVTGQNHFTDAEGASPLLENTEVTTLTYTNNCGLLRVHRYAASKLVQSLGGRVIAVDKEDNILVAGQSHGGKTNDLVLLKYPP